MALTVVQPGVGGTGNTNLTYPSSGGTVMVSGNMPAFSAYKNGDQSISSGTLTKVTYSDEEYDTNNNFASSRFTPTVAGYYQISAATDCAATALTRSLTVIYKNGSPYRYCGLWVVAASSEITSNVSSLVYCNGTTDYIEIYAMINGTSPTIYSSASPAITWFCGSLVRTA